jgi:hypothetical protein
MRMKLAALVALALLPSVSRATSAPDTVRGYFAALEQRDFRRALDLTAGTALERTNHMIDRLASEAAAWHAQVEVKVRSLHVEPAGAVGEQPVPVDVSFDIDVIGRKWMFRRLARRLTGTARFLVDEAAAQPRIVAIVGRID